MAFLVRTITGSKVVNSLLGLKKDESQAKIIAEKIQERAAQKAVDRALPLTSKSVTIEDISRPDKHLQLFAMQCILLDLFIVDKQGSERQRVEKMYRSIMCYEEPVVQQEELSEDDELDQILPPLNFESDATEENTPLPTEQPSARRSFPWIF